MSGIIGKKIGMTSLYLSTNNGETVKQVACTLIEAGPCVVTQVKTQETDEYEAIQLAFGERKEKTTSQPLLKHFEKAKTTPKHKLIEFAPMPGKDLQLGDILRVEDVFAEGDKVSVVGTSKGKGFQGVVKRHGFRGVGDGTHGQHNRQRHPGSIGSSSYPSRVFKGLRMAGRTGGDRIKVKNLKVLKVIPEQNLIVISGSTPGAKGSYIIIEK